MRGYPQLGGCGCGGGCGTAQRAAQLRGLGDTTTAQLPSMIQAANNAMNALYGQIAQYPDAISATSNEMVQDLQARLTAIEQAYWTLYQISTGQAPPTLAGLNGLMRARRLSGRSLAALGQIFQWTIGLGSLALIAAALYEWNKAQNNTAAQIAADVQKWQALQSQQTNVTYAQQMLAAAQASGDTVAAAQWAQAIADNPAYNVTTPTTPGITDWLTANWPWLAAGVFGLVVLQDVL